jgi:hypothetical protein
MLRGFSLFEGQGRSQSSACGAFLRDKPSRYHHTESIGSHKLRVVDQVTRRRERLLLLNQFVELDHGLRTFQ